MARKSVRASLYMPGGSKESDGHFLVSRAIDLATAIVVDRIRNSRQKHTLCLSTSTRVRTTTSYGYGTGTYAVNSFWSLLSTVRSRESNSQQEAASRVTKRETDRAREIVLAAQYPVQRLVL